MEHVSELLARKSPQFNTVAATCRVSDALYQMTCENADFLVVLEDNRFKGIITDHDIASRILFEDRPLNQIPVTDFMNANLLVVSPELSLAGCLQLMEHYSARHVAVYDRWDFRGVVSNQDLLQEVLKTRSDLFTEEESPRTGYPWTY